jgi:putative transposase
VESKLKEILHQIASDNHFEITEIEADADHIHLLIDCSPQHSIPNIIKALKGVSSKVAIQRVPSA